MALRWYGEVDETITRVTWGSVLLFTRTQSNHITVRRHSRVMISTRCELETDVYRPQGPSATEPIITVRMLSIAIEVDSSRHRLQKGRRRQTSDKR